MIVTSICFMRRPCRPAKRPRPHPRRPAAVEQRVDARRARRAASAGVALGHHHAELLHRQRVRAPQFLVPQQQPLHAFGQFIHRRHASPAFRGRL
jgi:hypothetical protein